MSQGGGPRAHSDTAHPTQRDPARQALQPRRAGARGNFMMSKRKSATHAEEPVLDDEEPAVDDGDARTSGREASAVSGPGRGRTVERGEINARKEERIQRYGADAGDARTSKHDAWARRERCR